MSRRLQAALRAALAWSPGRSGAMLDLVRVDYLWALGTWAVSVALFSTVLSSHPGLSDASESVAGVASVGILHAPGYPSYVLAARLFAWIIPVGDMSFRVGLFSLLCASLSVALVQLLARRFGAPRWAASLGALTLAFGAGFWFYAGFTKHDQFSGLCFLVALYLLLSWEALPTTWRLTGFAAAMGIGLGSSWPLMVLLIPTVLYVLVRSRRQLNVRTFTVSTIAGLAMLIGSYGFVMVRAAADPPINWGHATTISQVMALVKRSDFNVAPTPPAGAATSRQSTSSARQRGSSAQAPASHGRASSASRAFAYAPMFWRELGAVAFLLAIWGAIASLTWRRRTISIPLLIAFLANLLGAAVTVSPGSSSYSVDLIEEGFVLGCLFVLACWVALGAGDLADRAGRLAGRSAQRGWARWLSPVLAGVLGVAVLLPLAIVGWPVAHRSDNAYADSYANTVFSELPHGAALFVWGADLNLPLSYRQVVYHQRPDVAVISAGELRLRWYQRQVAKELGTPLGPVTDTVAGLSRVIESVQRLRPTYIDVAGIPYVAGHLGYRLEGLVAQVVPGTRASTAPPAQLERTITAAARRAGMPSANWTVWPNVYVAAVDYAPAAIQTAQAACRQQQYQVMRASLLTATAIDPLNQTARNDLALGVPSAGEKVNC